MAGNELLHIIKDDFDALKKEGQNEINIDALINYLNTLDTQKERDKDVELEHLRTINQSNLNLQQHNLEAYLETFKATLTAGSNVVKMLMLVNGGAAIALLAFIGNIWTKDNISDYVPFLSVSLKYFCFGVAASLGCAGFTYFCQLTVSHNYFEPTKVLTFFGHAMNAFASICGFISIGYFFYGVKAAAELFFKFPLH